MADILARYSESIDDALASCLPFCDSEKYRILTESMRYSVFAGGKRIRPALVLEFCRICGGNVEQALPFGCAIELIHTYSLIHDDLPCMDNDDYRRGKPSNHKAFGEDIALLSGDALQAEAYRALARADLPSDRIVEAIKVLSALSGTTGMVGGQVMDLTGDNRTITLDDLQHMYALKTSALLRCACKLGCIAAGNFECVDAADRFGYYLGLAFQVRDDVLDVIGEQAVLGKPIGSDRENEKPTVVELIGLDEADRLVETYSDNALDALSVFGEKAADLVALTQLLRKRDH